MMGLLRLISFYLSGNINVADINISMCIHLKLLALFWWKAQYDLLESSLMSNMNS